MIKKILLNIFIVLLVIFVLDFAIGRTLRYFYFKESSGFNYRTTYAMEETRADILIFGSSTANHHYVPGVFENSLKMTYYNTGRDGLGILVHTAILESVLKRYTPKLIILDYTGSFQKEEKAYDRLAVLLPYWRTHPEIRKIIELRSPFERIKLISEIYPFNSQILNVAVGNLEVNKKRMLDHEGYVALNKKWQDKMEMIKPGPAYSVDSNKILALKDFIKTAKQSGSQVILIHSPWYKEFKTLQEIDICRTVCAEADIPFWDYTKDTLFLNNRQLFEDRSHLNNTGATIFSNLVAAKIKKSRNVGEHALIRKISLEGDRVK